MVANLFYLEQAYSHMGLKHTRRPTHWTGVRKFAERLWRRSSEERTLLALFRVDGYGTFYKEQTNRARYYQLTVLLALVPVREGGERRSSSC